ncbi:MAG: shikimate kinase [Candidatus Petromonas sp.]|nr:shikimate kinase [Candidatus Petromonas sp.]
MKKNIVLIGFMGTGKTTVGKKVAEKISLSFIDSDEEIVKKSGMSINEIFNRFGEEYFRKIEGEVIEELSNLEGYVISTGGGIVKNQENILNLKGKGAIIYLNGSAKKIEENIKKDADNRPLLKTDNVLNKIISLLEERKDLYRKAMDFEIIIDSLSVDEVAEKVIDIYRSI